MGKNDIRITLPKRLYDQIEQDVVKLYKELNLSIPVNPYDVAKSLGYIVIKLSEIGNNNELYKLRFDDDGHPRDGLSYYDPDMHTYIILVNDIDTFKEKHDEFTIMHEIGHIRMNHKTGSLLAEKIANHYAAYALIPSPLPSMYGCNDFTDLINVFDVSIDCAYNCWKRVLNWQMYSGINKEYEKDLKEYFDQKRR